MEGFSLSALLEKSRSIARCMYLLHQSHICLTRSLSDSDKEDLSTRSLKLRWPRLETSFSNALQIPKARCIVLVVANCLVSFGGSDMLICLCAGEMVM